MPGNKNSLSRGYFKVKGPATARFQSFAWGVGCIPLGLAGSLGLEQIKVMAGNRHGFHPHSHPFQAFWNCWRPSGVTVPARNCCFPLHVLPVAWWVTGLCPLSKDGLATVHSSPGATVIDQGRVCDWAGLIRLLPDIFFVNVGEENLLLSSGILWTRQYKPSAVGNRQQKECSLLGSGATGSTGNMGRGPFGFRLLQVSAPCGTSPLKVIVWLLGYPVSNTGHFLYHRPISIL